MRRLFNPVREHALAQRFDRVLAVIDEFTRECLAIRVAPAPERRQQPQAATRVRVGFHQVVAPDMERTILKRRTITR